MPMLLFDDDPGQRLGSLFCQEALRAGVYLHPRHNLFLSLAHTEADIDTVLVATDGALAAAAAARRAGVA